MSRRDLSPAPHPNAAIADAIVTIVRTEVAKEIERLGLCPANLLPHELRVRAGMKLRDLAARSGISHVTISNIENGKIRDPRPETIDAIARGLGVAESVYRSAVVQMLAHKRLAC